jgi:hypothetical protein
MEKHSTTGQKKRLELNLDVILEEIAQKVKSSTCK